MFKAKLKIWIPILIISMLLQHTTVIVNGFHVFHPSAEFIISNEMDFDKVTIDAIFDKKFNNVLLKSGSENPDVKIVSGNDAIDGYTKLNNEMMSPLVMFINGSSLERESTLFNYSKEYYMTDLSVILNGMYEDKNWEDVDVSDRTVEGKITLTIPDEDSPYYPIVKKLFEKTLNNDSEKVEAVLKKCNKVKNIRNEIQNVMNLNEFKKNTSVFIGPEFLTQQYSYVNRNNPFHNSSYQRFETVYFEETEMIRYSIYVRDSLMEEDGTGGFFVSAITKDDDFLEKTGWRITNAKKNFADGPNYN